MPATTPHLTLDRAYLRAVYGGKLDAFPTLVREDADDDEFYQLAHHALPEACGFDLIEAYVAAQDREDGDLVVTLTERYEGHLRACTTVDQAFEAVQLLAAAMALVAPPT